MPLPSPSLYPSPSLLPEGAVSSEPGGQGLALPANSKWMFVLADHAGANLAELSTATGKTLTFARNGVPEARMVISHDDDAATRLLDALVNGVPTLRAYRDGVLRFHGYLAPFSEELEEDTKLNLVFRGPFGRLVGDGQARGRFVSASYTQVDAGQIAWSLIAAAQASGTAGIGSGTIEATKLRDRTYENVNVGEAVTALTRVLDGFDFEVTPIEYTAGIIGHFNVYSSQGVVQTAVRFEYGPDTLRNVRKVTRQMQPPINVARVLGANGLVSVKTDAASVATHGRWEVQESLSDVSEQATLDDRAQAMLRPNWIRVVGFSPEPELAPAPWDDFWLGDTVLFYGWRGAFAEATTSRVSKVTIVVDDEGNEATEIEDPGFEGASLEARVETEVVTSNLVRRSTPSYPAPVYQPLLLPFNLNATIGS